MTRERERTLDDRLGIRNVQLRILTRILVSRILDSSSLDRTTCVLQNAGKFIEKK